MQAETILKATYPIIACAVLAALVACTAHVILAAIHGRCEHIHRAARARRRMLAEMEQALQTTRMVER